MDMERRYRQLQRATVARSALDVIAMIFLGCGFCFWGVAFWQLLSPPQLASLLSIQAAVLALAFSLAAPLLLSMLVPTTPAGQLLQKTQWATIGFYVILGSAAFLVFQAEHLIETWLYGQPGVRELGNWRALAFVLVIAFVVIPALAWVQLTPERWVQSVQQAHAVKKLELQQRGELAIIKASLIRAETLAAIGWANLLPLEQEEAVKSLQGLLMASSDTMRSVIRTLGLSADLERSIMDDADIAEGLEYIKDAIDVLPEISPAARADTAPIVRMRDLPPQEMRQAVATAVDQAVARHVDTRPQSSESRETPDATCRQVTTPDDAYARAGRAAFGRVPWEVKRLAAELNISETSARAMKDEWLRAGVVKEARMGRWYFTESEA